VATATATWTAAWVAEAQAKIIRSYLLKDGGEVSA
jgi:hypothetical protein